MSDAPLAIEAGPRRAAPRTVLIGTVLVSIGIVMAFAVMVAAYAQLRDSAGGTTDAWVPSGVTFRNAQLVFTLMTLVIGSVALQWGVTSSRNIDANNTRTALALTLAFGALHVNMMLFSVDAFGVGIGEVWSNLVFTITGAGIALSGVAMAYVAVALLKAFGGQLGVSNPTIPGAAVFWNVHVGIWFLIFFAIFAVK
ncbi:MAG: hypothetical protein AAGA99_09835 [Actinomycetota bacterium]